MRPILRPSPHHFSRALPLLALAGALCWPSPSLAITGNSPARIANLANVTKVAATQTSSVFLKADGTVWTLGNFNCSPTQVSFPAGVSITDIAAGAGHVVALASGGSVYAFGDNNYGELGNCTTTSSTSPVQVMVSSTCTRQGGPTALSGASAVAAGGFHSLALISNGTVQAWGRNDYGQLGDGSTTQRTAAVPVSTLTGAVQVAAGGYHSLALLSNSQVMGWGRAADGQLGDVNCIFSYTVPTHMQLYANGSSVNFNGTAAIAAGNEFSIMVQAAKGAVWTTGNGGRGELGIGTTASSCWPVQISGFKNIVLAAAGPESEYALALRLVSPPVAPFAWGRNDMDQVGNNSNTDALSPVAIAIPAGITLAQGRGSLAGGGLHSLAVATDGTVVGWGNNVYCALGN